MPTPSNAPYKEAQRKNAERFLTRGRLLWPGSMGTRLVRREEDKKLTKAEKKEEKKKARFRRMLAAFLDGLVVWRSKAPWPRREKVDRA